MVVGMFMGLVIGMFSGMFSGMFWGLFGGLGGFQDLCEIHGEQGTGHDVAASRCV